MMKRQRIVEIELNELAECYDPTSPLDSPVYKAQCITFKLAKVVSGISSSVTTTQAVSDQVAPYCLRIKPQYRHKTTQAFRNKIAAEMRAIRAAS
jgi:hypothetical protein